MKFLILLLSLLTSLSTIADSLTFVKRMKVGEEYVGDKLQDGKRFIFVWPAETVQEIEAKNYSEELKKGKLYPYQTFKEGVNETYRKFNELSKNFNSCVEGKKWPESRECLKEIKYCFDGKGIACDSWSEDGRSERCKFLGIWKCIHENEAQFEVLRKCFRPQNGIGFRFISYDNKAIWEDTIGVRSIGAGLSDSKGVPFYANCDFVYYKGVFHLKQITDDGSYYDGVKITVPEDYDWKAK